MVSILGVLLLLVVVLSSALGDVENPLIIECIGLETGSKGNEEDKGVYAVLLA